MNNHFVNITKNLDVKPLVVSNTSDIDEITKHSDDHISVYKIKEAIVKFYKKIILVLKWFPWTKPRK